MKPPSQLLSDIDVVVVGGGVVGLFCALECAKAGLETVLLEALPRTGLLSSTRNSGVIHAGIYYRTGSLKARLCVEGRRMLYAFAQKAGVTHRKSGKLIVAITREEEDQLIELKERGERNGVEGLKLVGRERIAALEPHVAGRAALLSSETGVIDQSELIAAVRAAAEASAATVLTNAHVERIEPDTNSLTVITKDRGAIRARAVINAAGTCSIKLAQTCGLTRWRQFLVRGCYANVIPRRSDLVRGLVYPVPGSKLSLGVHFTRTAHGELLVGPDAKPLGDVTCNAPNEFSRLCAVDPDIDGLFAAARALVPSLEKEDLRAGDCGIRCKIASATTGEVYDDFVLEFSPDTPPVLHLLGIDSPGLTAAPALGKTVAEKLKERI